MKIILFILTTFAAGCSSLHPEKIHSNNYQKAISDGQCEKAQEAIPLEKDETKNLRLYQGTVGYLLSVSTLPITLTLDLILLQRCRFGCTDPNDKQNNKILEVLFPTTSWTYEESKDMRCPDNSYYLHKFLEIAQCYEKRADLESLKTAHAQVEYFDQSYQSTFTCIKVEDGKLIQEQLKRLKKITGMVLVSAQVKMSLLTESEKELYKIGILEKEKKLKRQKKIIKYMTTGKVYELADLIESIEDANLLNEKGESLLMVAAKRGDQFRSELLIKKGADVSFKSRNGLDALFYAEKGGDAEVIYLIKRELRKIVSPLN